MIDLSSIGQNIPPGGLIGVILRALGLLKGGKGAKGGGVQSIFSDMPVSRGAVSSGLDRRIGNPPAVGVGPIGQVREVGGLRKAPT